VKSYALKFEGSQDVLEVVMTLFIYIWDLSIAAEVYSKILCVLL
jgi:hypothetical protein